MSDAKTFEEALLLYLPEVNAGTIKTIVAAHARELAAARAETWREAARFSRSTLFTGPQSPDEIAWNEVCKMQAKIFEQRAAEAQKEGK